MPKAWKIAPGDQAKVWDMCRDRGCIVIGWREIGDYRQYKSAKAIEKKLTQAYPDWKVGTGPGAAKNIWRFANEVQPKDLVIANDGRAKVVGIGVVKSDYLPPGASKNPSQHEGYTSARRVDWRIVKPIQLPKWFFPQNTVWPLEPAQCEKIKHAYLKNFPEYKATLDQLFHSVSPHDERLGPAEQKLLDQNAFDPVSIKDGRTRIERSIVQRRGQPAFRMRLLSAYNGRCAISGCKVEEILEAAHIVPYRGSQTNHPANGLLLRTDIHTLFDVHLIAVDSKMMCLLTSPKLKGTEYEKYAGKPIAVPGDLTCRSSQKALESHRKKSKL
jgi:hypothetical protein